MKKMRRDVVYYYQLPLNDVFNAFVQGVNVQLGKDCKVVQGISISFGLNYSLIYNMNGGACNIHFMPHLNGTAVDIHYTIIQLSGAKYKAHAQKLAKFVNYALKTKGKKIRLSVKTFMAYEQQVMGSMQQNPAGSQPVMPQNQAGSQPIMPQNQPVAQQPMPQNQVGVQPVMPRAGQKGRFCTSCGTPYNAGTTICVKCGRRLP